MWPASGYAPTVTTGRRLLLAAKRLVVALGYVALMVVVALGSAGIIAMWSHPPGTAARAELTWHADSTLGPRLDAAQADLATVAANVDRLALLARGALAALNSSEQQPFTDALAEGGTIAASIETDSSELRARLGSLPATDPANALTYGSDVLARRGAMTAALDATQGLGRSWAILTAGSLAASQLIALLDDHDTIVATAAGQGRDARYADALATLATAVARLDAAVKIRDQVANSADVSTLDLWIASNRHYDEALTALYTALKDSGGKVNDAVKQAFKAEGEARALLPPDPRGLVVIVADIGRGGLNQAVIAIEQARSRLDLALEALTSAAPSAVGGGPG